MPLYNTRFPKLPLEKTFVISEENSYFDLKTLMKANSQSSYQHQLKQLINYAFVSPKVVFDSIHFSSDVC